jgi:hypothetical protein
LSFRNQGHFIVTQHSTILTAAALLALLLAGCATQAQAPVPATPIGLSPATQGEVTKYLRTVKVTRPGAFAVSPDGRNSFYTWCDDIACMTSNYSIPALRGCQGLSGTPCVILYVRQEQRVASTVDNNAATGGQHGSEQQQRIEFDNRN